MKAVFRYGAAIGLCLMLSGCGKTETVTKVVYRDGYVVVTGVPDGIETITLKLSARGGTYRTTITVLVRSNRTANICLGAMFRTDYAAGDIEVITWNSAGQEVKRLKNEATITLDGTETTQEIPYDSFAEQS